MAKTPPFVPNGLTLTNSTISGPTTTTPDAIPGLQMWLDASQSVYKPGNAVRCSAAGNQVSVWPDRSGNGNIATASGTLPTYDPVGMNGKPTINFNGNSKLVTNSFLGGTYTAGFTLFVVSKASAGAANKVVVGSALNGLYLQRNDAAKTTSFSLLGVSPSPTVNPYVNASGVDALVYRGSSYTYEYDHIFNPVGGLANSGSNSVNAITTTGSVNLTGAMTIGDLAGGGFAWPGQISEVLIWNTALTNEQYRMVYDYLSAKWGFSNKSLVLCAGNSLTSGMNSTGGPTQSIAPTGSNYPGQLWGFLGAAGYDVRTDAYPGRTTQQMLNEVPAYGDMLWLPTASPKNICVAWEITNTLAQGQSSAAAYDQIVRFCNARRARGYKTIVVTCLPCTSTYPAFLTEYLAINTQIRANYRLFADGIADVALDSRLLDITNTTYFSSDQIHLTDAGYGIVAGIVAAAIAALP